MTRPRRPRPPVSYPAHGPAILGAHVTLAAATGRVLLGTVTGVRWSRDRWRLTVRHFCGDPWPIEPTLADVTILERTYEDGD